MTYPWEQAPLDSVFFDLDGTLLNSAAFGLQAIVNAFDILISHSALPGVTEPRQRRE